MNPDKPSREQIEARITALLLGELPAEEAELLRWTISQDAELQKLHGRLLLTIGLVREVVGHPEEASAEKAVPRNLSDERRQKLLAYFKTPRPRQASGELFWLKRIEVRPLVTALALVAILGMLAAMFLPALASAKRKAQNVTALSMAKQKALEERIQAEENPPASVRAAPLPVAVMPPPPPAVTLAVAPPPPTEIVLPRGGEPTSIESEKGTVLSAQIVGYANSAVPATPQAQATPNVALSLGRAVDVGDLFDRKQSKTENAGVISELARSGGNSGGNGGGGGGFGGFGIGGASSSQNSALQQRQQNGVTTMSSTTANSGIGGVSGVGGGSAETSVVNKRVDQFGIAEPVANATPTDTTLAWNVSVTDRSRTENQSENDWHGGTSLGPVPNGGDVAALQNKSQIVGGETFYRSQNGEVAAEKEKTPVLGDAPLVGRWFASSATAPTAAPAPSSAPARPEMFFKLSEPGPENMAENSTGQPKSSSSAERLNGVNTFTGGAVVNAGALTLDDLETIDGRTTGKGDRLNLGVAMQESRAQNALGLPTESANKNGDLAYNNSGQMLASGLRNDQNGEVLQAELARRPSRQMLIESAHRLDGDTNNNPAPAPVVAMATTQPGMVARFAYAYVVTNAVSLNVSASTQKVELSDSLQPAPAAVIADRQVLKPPQPAPIPQPEFLTRENAFSTFSMNVSDVSFKLAQASLQNGRMPDAASIRSEEFINAFDYRDPEAAAGVPVSFTSERARYPFAQNRDLLRFSIKTAAAGRAANRPLNLVLLLDNSGSMERADRVAIIREALRVLAAQLQPQDTVSVVTFARTARLWADGVSGDKAGETLDQVGSITPDGGTNLEEAMRLAYETAHRHYLAQGVNRVVLLTDGAANLGNVDPGALKRTVEAQRRQGIALDCFGIGWDDYNDNLLAELSGNGDGRYAFINSPDEAGTDFAAKLAGALQVAAQDVKVQVEFNPQRVISWRQIGYAKHQLTKEQFRDNSVLAAEIAAQEAGNALYTVETKPDGIGPVATVRVRYKIPGTEDIREMSWDAPYTGNSVSLEKSSAAMRLAATASAFSEWLAASPFAQEVSPDELLKDLSGVPQIYGADQRPAQLETMIREARSITGK